MPRSNSVCTTARRPAWRGLTGLVATFGLAAFVAACGGSETPASPASPESISVAERYDWYSFGGDHTERHFAPLDQINTDNVAQLQKAWTYRSGDMSHAYDESPHWGSEATPIKIGNTAYTCTPNAWVVAPAVTITDNLDAIFEYRQDEVEGGEDTDTMALKLILTF